LPCAPSAFARWLREIKGPVTSRWPPALCFQKALAPPNCAAGNCARYWPNTNSFLPQACRFWERCRQAAHTDVAGGRSLKAHRDISKLAARNPLRQHAPLSQRPVTSGKGWQGGLCGETLKRADPVESRAQWGASRSL
jgi:hypothetical protein